MIENNTAMQLKIEKAWDDRKLLKAAASQMQESVIAIEEAISGLDSGSLKVCELINGVWEINQWLKKAILLFFLIRENELMQQSLSSSAFDKIPLKFQNWGSNAFISSGIRAVPGSIVRYGAYIEQNTVLMPSFINIGVRIGSGTMIDSFATVGSCVHVGSSCHISSSVVLGGVLEPLNTRPVIIEDNVFIGTGSIIAEGVLVEQDAVVGSGVSITSSTKIYNRETKEISYGVIPRGSVVVSGIAPDSATMCAVIVKSVDAVTRSKVGINELLRA
ncbi:MAG: 2,3,4,5-tetrahydropyridine-2,6-dicarboxylate N-succinyltransferase [Candidatus Lariskella arthropodorum]